MLNVDCRYLQRGFTDSVTDEGTLPLIGLCTHPRMRRDNPACEGCAVPLQAKHQICPGVSQKFDALTEQFRFRCTIHRVKISEPLGQCKTLRNCPLDREEPLSIASVPARRPLEVAAGTVAAALARRVSAMNAGERAG